jgi:uncharacterized protein YcgL (UPF0745 family)
MTFSKALKLLLKGKCKSIKNEDIKYYKQTIENIGYWIAEQRQEEARKKAFTDIVFSKTWEVDEV